MWGTSVASGPGVTGLRFHTWKDSANQQWHGSPTCRWLYWCDVVEDFIWADLPCIELLTPLHVSKVLCGKPYMVTRLKQWGFSFVLSSKLLVPSNHLIQAPMCILLHLFTPPKPFINCGWILVHWNAGNLPAKVPGYHPYKTGMEYEFRIQVHVHSWIDMGQRVSFLNMLHMDF